VGEQKLHFIAILPPEPLLEELKQFKLEAKDKFNTKRSLNSPAHITLIPPFGADDDIQQQVKEFIPSFLANQNDFTIQLNGFSRFDRRVIFVDVIKEEKLMHLQAEMEKEFRKQIPVKLPKYRGYNPHVTIAFRDLKEELFGGAWDNFKDRDYKRSFSNWTVALLRHNGKDWDTIATYSPASP
jgi:2'-5' RNA ligase